MRGSVPGSRIAVWAALVASLAAATLFVAVKVATPSDGGRVAFYDHAWTADGVQIDPIDAPQPDLLAGDLVQAIDGRSMEAWAGALLDPSAVRPAAGTLPYQVERSGEAASIGGDLGAARRGAPRSPAGGASSCCRSASPPSPASCSSVGRTSPPPRPWCWSPAASPAAASRGSSGRRRAISRWGARSCSMRC